VTYAVKSSQLGRQWNLIRVASCRCRQVAEAGSRLVPQRLTIRDACRRHVGTLFVISRRVSRRCLTPFQCNRQNLCFRLNGSDGTSEPKGNQWLSVMSYPIVIVSHPAR
jgi:hypothetical protein